MQRPLFLVLRYRKRQINKHFHIWSGHAAFIAGAIQCYRGVELVSSQDSLVFSTFEIDYQVRVQEILEWFNLSSASFRGYGRVRGAVGLLSAIAFVCDSKRDIQMFVLHHAEIRKHQ